MPAPTATPPAPLRLFNRRDRVGRRAHRRAIGRSRLRRRHTEETKKHSHQRCYDYSLHQVCLPLLLSSIERDELSQRNTKLVTGPFTVGSRTGSKLLNNPGLLPRFPSFFPVYPD